MSGIMLGTIWSGAPIVAQAQPATAVPAGTERKEDQKRRDFIRIQLAPLTGTNTEAALALGREYLTNNPDNLNPWQRVLARTDIARHIAFNSPKEFSPEQHAAMINAVLALLDQGLAVVSPERNPKGSEGDILELQRVAIEILRVEKRWDAAEQRLEQSWPLLLRARDIRPWMVQVRELYERQGKSRELCSLCQQAFQERLLKMGRFEGNLCKAVAESLVAENREEEALSWAKLSFVVCDFDEGAIKDTTQTLAKVWTVRDLSAARAQQFALAQSDASTPNPLVGIALPQFDTGALRSLVSDDPLKLRVEDRITLLLILGEFRQAMQLARGMIVDKPNNENGARQVARVFKAKDGNIVRANQFLTYYQSGEGENPLTAFWKEDARTGATITP